MAARCPERAAPQRRVDALGDTEEGQPLLVPPSTAVPGWQRRSCGFLVVGLGAAAAVLLTVHLGHRQEAAAAAIDERAALESLAHIEDEWDAGEEWESVTKSSTVENVTEVVRGKWDWWSRAMQGWWDLNRRPLLERQQEMLERGQEMEHKLQQQLQSKVGDLTNETKEFSRQRFRHQMKRALQSSLNAVGNFSVTAEAWKDEIKDLMKTKEFLNGSTAAQCPDLDGLYIEKVLHSNLGGQGPGTGEESLIFASNHTEDGVTVKRLAFKITALSPYAAGWSQMNGLSHGLVGKYGQVTLKPATNVTLRIQTFDLDSGVLIRMNSAAFTFFDLDEDAGHEASEFVTVRNYDSVELSANTEVRTHTNGDGSMTFQASTQGTFEDNPIDPLLLTEQQKNRAVTFKFSNVDEVRVSIGATAAPSDPGTWRCFTFVAHPVLKCAKSLKVAGDKEPPPHVPLLFMLAGLVGVLGCVACCCFYCA